jgi:hypothetical protein
MAAIPRVTPPQKGPAEIEHKRYRSKRKGNEVVTVIGVTHSQGAHGWYSVVSVKYESGKKVSWPAGVFLRAFEPVGRKMRVKTIWQRIKGKDLI